MGSDLAELTTVKAEHEELREKVLGLKKDKPKFKECYDLLFREKNLVEDQVTSLEG